LDEEKTMQDRPNIASNFKPKRDRIPVVDREVENPNFDDVLQERRTQDPNRFRDSLVDCTFNPKTNKKRNPDNRGVDDLLKWGDDKRFKLANMRLSQLTKDENLLTFAPEIDGKSKRMAGKRNGNVEDRLIQSGLDTTAKKSNQFKIEQKEMFVPKISENSKKILAGRFPDELRKLDNGQTVNLDFWEAIPPGVRNATLTSKGKEKKVRIRRAEKEKNEEIQEEELVGKIDPNPSYTSPYTKELLGADIPLKDVIKRSNKINSKRSKLHMKKLENAKPKIKKISKSQIKVNLPEGGGRTKSRSMNRQKSQGRSRTDMPLASRSPVKRTKDKNRNNRSKRNLSRSQGKLRNSISRARSNSRSKSRKNSRSRSKRTLRDNYSSVQKFNPKSRSPSKKRLSGYNYAPRSPTKKELIDTAVAQLYTKQAQTNFQRQHELCPKKHNCSKSPSKLRNMPLRQKVCPRWKRGAQNPNESALSRRKRLWNDKQNVKLVKQNESMKTKKKMSSLIYGKKAKGRSVSKGRVKKDTFGMGTTAIGTDVGNWEMEPEVNIYDVGTHNMYESFKKLKDSPRKKSFGKDKRMSATFANVFIKGTSQSPRKFR